MPPGSTKELSRFAGSECQTLQKQEREPWFRFCSVSLRDMIVELHYFFLVATRKPLDASYALASEECPPSLIFETVAPFPQSSTA